MPSLLRLFAVLGALGWVSSVSAESVGPPDVSWIDAPPDAGTACEREEPGVNPPEGDVPANWPFFTFALIGDRRDARDVRLVRVSDGIEVPIVVRSTINVRVFPLEDLVVGEEYDLQHPACPPLDTLLTRHRTIAAIDEPATLGTIEISPLYAANRTRGTGYRFYFVEMHVTEDAGFAMEPWIEDRQTVAEVDGEIAMVTRVPSRPSTFHMDVSCHGSVGAWPGPRDLRALSFHVRERLRFASGTLSHTIEPCDDALRVDPDTLRPLTPDEIAYWDTAPMDAGLPATLDAGGLDGGRMDIPPARDTKTGCNCLVASSTDEGAASAGAASLLAIAALLSRLRRRRQRQ